jgi:hypothetical protein
MIMDPDHWINHQDAQHSGTKVGLEMGNGRWAVDGTIRNGGMVEIQWWFNGILMGFNVISWDLLGYMMFYPLVNIQKAMENCHL